MRGLLAAGVAAWLALNQVPQGGTVKGTVTLKGDAPARKVYKVPTPGLEPEQRAYPEGVPYDPVPIDADRRIASVLVYVKKGLEGKSFPAPAEPKPLRFEKFQIQPRMSAVMVGQDLVLANLDPTLHAMYADPRVKGNTGFNIGLPAKGGPQKRSFPRPEVCIPLTSRCLHEWERGWLAVLSHPYYAVTDEHGAFEISGLPPGKYTLEAWQENCTPVEIAVEIKVGETVTAEAVLEARR